jgi:hypothetical protein
MLLSVRAAADVLGAVGLTFEQTRLLLRSGIAGPGTHVGSARAYDAESVVSLVARPCLSASDLSCLAPRGLFVARLSRSTRLDLTRPWREVADALSEQPAMPAMTRSLLAARITGYERMPWVATLFGFVVLGADAVAISAETETGRTRFALEPPEEWWNTLAGSRLPTGRGRPGLLLLPQAQPEP